MTSQRRAVMALIAVVEWGALVLQLWLTVQLYTANGGSVVGGILRYFSYFTILTNTLLGVVVTWPLVAPASRFGQWCLKGSVHAAVLLYITVVGITYSLLLRNTLNPTGWQAVADRLLHDVLPLAFVGYWLALVPKGTLRWGQVGGWLIYPAAYFGFVLIAGAVNGFYPYPFVDVNALGYGRACVNAATLVGLFLVLSAFVLWIDRWLGRRAGAVTD